ncbi:unnamed protein product [Phytophthora fragariaefolia]|uniref:Unnamed protein product n=1 Tax=Phytophthora fragariaefolia TaxID=1490495 RepID=A0A9W6XAL6_9STRA|nr:unnamed protein product [Phytophthora fragariaefolia]
MFDGARVSEKRHRVGRRPSPVWNFFTEIRLADNRVYASCNFCGKRSVGVASRLRSHVLNKCEKAPSDIDRQLTAAIVPFPSSDATADIPSTPSVDADPVPLVVTGSAPVSITDTRSPPTKRLKKDPQVVEEVVVAAVSHDEEADAEADDGVEVDQVSYDPPPELAQGYTEQEADAVHQKLVLACVLNDVPASFVEDDALMEAFSVARPGLPRLTAEQAKTSVLDKLAGAAAKKMEDELVNCKVLTLVHRHFKKLQNAVEPEKPSRWCNRWVGVDEHRKVVPLKETCPEVGATSSFTSDEVCCRLCPPRDEVDAVISTYQLCMAPEAVLSLCCECPQMYLQLRHEQQQARLTPVQVADSLSANAAKSKTQVLLSSCLLRQSLVLRKELLNAFPAVVDLLNKAIFLGHSVSKISPLRPQLKGLLESSNWDAVPCLIKRMVLLEDDIRRYQAKVSVPDVEVSSFWRKLRAVDTLLTPFNWMLALSEAKETTSAQYLVLWLWLLSIVKTALLPFLPKQDKECFVNAVMSLIRRFVDPHVLVCMLLDPRVAGAGLSVSGIRRVKSLVVQLAERVFPSEGFGNGAPRSQLLTQLGDYTEKLGGFEDAIVWEMSAGRSPKLFWNDFVEEAPHLARVARTVLSVAPCAQSATQSLSPSPPTEEFAWEQSFAVRQVKFQAQKLPRKATGGVKQYESLLFRSASSQQGNTPDGPLSSEVDKALRGNNTPRWSASVESEVEAYVTLQLRSMLQVGGDLEQHSDAYVPAPSVSATTSSHSVSPSWFAFQSPNDRKALEQAVRSFLPCPTAAAEII